MPEHHYTYENVASLLASIRHKTLGEIDNKNIFDYVLQQDMKLQKGIAGTVIEQCVFNYSPDSKQEADLLISYEHDVIETELKTTGMLFVDNHYVAKEPMSITAVGVFDIPDQTFEQSHFWNKIHHLLIVYYEYKKKKDGKVTPYDYKDFPIIDFDFHEFSSDEIEGLKRDWKLVHDLCSEVVHRHPGPRTPQWEEIVKKDYIDSRIKLRGNLTYINLAPKYPPRFRLKKPVVSSMIFKKFGYALEKIPGKYVAVNDVDVKCKQLEKKYRNRTIDYLAEKFCVAKIANTGNEKKSIVEEIVVKMFGGEASSLNEISLFVTFGLVAKTIVVTPKGGRTEDMKLFKIDFDDLIRETIDEIDDQGNTFTRPFEFEDSDLYNYFSDNEFLCIICEEPEKEYLTDDNGEFIRDDKGKKIEIHHSLLMNKFIGFRRLVFSEEFINSSVRKLWEDTRDKVINRKLVDVVQYQKGMPVHIKSDGSISSAPNFMKSSQNDVFIRGSKKNSALVNKTEIVNGIKMIPQYYWIKGKAVISELKSQHGDFLDETSQIL